MSRSTRAANLTSHSSRVATSASMIVTSEQAVLGWGEIFGDEVVATAMIDRLVHHSEIVSPKGDSYRLGTRTSAPAPPGRRPRSRDRIGRGGERRGLERRSQRPPFSPRPRPSGPIRRKSPRSPSVGEPQQAASDPLSGSPAGRSPLRPTGSASPRPSLLIGASIFNPRTGPFSTALTAFPRSVRLEPRCLF